MLLLAPILKKHCLISTAPCLISVKHACAASLNDTVQLSPDAIKVFYRLIQLGPCSFNHTTDSVHVEIETVYTQSDTMCQYAEIDTITKQEVIIFLLDKFNTISVL